MPKKTITSPAKKADEQNKYIHTLGKRKRAIARIRLYDKGKGEITINQKKFDDYFKDGELQGIIETPLNLANARKIVDITILVQGGGKKGQAEAIRHGIAKALEKWDANLRKTMKVAGLLTRDSRIKERKKPGLKRARKAPQWAKR